MKLFKGCTEGHHKFEPRYDKGPAELPLDRFKSLSSDADALETFRRVVYVRDVCVRCGTVIERERLSDAVFRQPNG